MLLGICVSLRAGARLEIFVPSGLNLFKVLVRRCSVPLEINVDQFEEEFCGVEVCWYWETNGLKMGIDIGDWAKVTGLSRRQQE